MTLVDTDAFCKLGTAGLLEDAVGIFGARIDECGRLPELKYMLRGRLSQSCGALASIADQMRVAPAPSDFVLETFVLIDGIDRGEAKLFATAMESDDACMVITSDKTAVRALQGIGSTHEALAGHIVVLEAILLRLCIRHGLEEITERVARSSDNLIRLCFDSQDPEACLWSYYNSLATEAVPLSLWDPATDLR